MTRTIQRLPARGTDQSPGVRTSHGFAHGRHPGPTSLGGLVLHDEHLLDPGHGFAEHGHRELEIVTWVVQGRLEHRGATRTSLGPGSVQHLRAGSGVRHAERADDVRTRVVQCWLLPDEPGREPSYAARDCSGDLGNGLARVLTLPEGSLHVARLAAGGEMEVPTAAYAHVFCASGETDLLAAGDALLLTEDTVRLTATTPAELLVWVLSGTVWHPGAPTTSEQDAP